MMNLITTNQNRKNSAQKSQSRNQTFQMSQINRSSLDAEPNNNANRNSGSSHELQSYYTVHKNLKTDFRSKRYNKIYRTLALSCPEDPLYLPLYYQDYLICIIKIIQNSAYLSINTSSPIGKKGSIPGLRDNKLLSISHSQISNIRNSCYDKKTSSNSQQIQTGQKSKKKQITACEQIIRKLLGDGAHIIDAFYYYFSLQGRILNQKPGNFKVNEINPSKAKFISSFLAMIVQFLYTIALAFQDNQQFSEAEFLYRKGLILVHIILQSSTSNIRVISKSVQFLTNYANFTLTKRNQINFGLCLLYRALVAGLNEIYLLNIYQKYKKRVYRLKSKKLKAFHRLKNVYINLAVVFEKLNRLQRVYSFLQQALIIQKYYIFPIQRKVNYGLMAGHSNGQRKSQNLQLFLDGVLSDKQLIKRFKEIHDERSQLKTICQRYFDQKTLKADLFDSDRIDQNKYNIQNIENPKKNLCKTKSYKSAFFDVLEAFTKIIKTQQFDLDNQQENSDHSQKKNIQEKQCQFADKNSMDSKQVLSLNDINTNTNDQSKKNIKPHQKKSGINLLSSSNPGYLPDSRIQDFIKENLSEESQNEVKIDILKAKKSKNSFNEQEFNKLGKLRSGHHAIGSQSYKSIKSNNEKGKQAQTKINQNEHSNLDKQVRSNSFNHQKGHNINMDDRILLYGQNFWNVDQIKKSLSRSVSKSSNKIMKSKSHEVKELHTQSGLQNKRHLQNKKQYKQYIKQGQRQQTSVHRFMSKSKRSRLNKKTLLKQTIQINNQFQQCQTSDSVKRLNRINQNDSPSDHIPYNVVCDNFRRFQQKSTELKHFAEKRIQKMKLNKQNQLDKYDCQSQQQLNRHKDDQKILNGFKKKITKHDQQKFQQKIKATLLVSHDIFKSKKSNPQENKAQKKKTKQNGFRLKGIQLLKSLIIKNRRQIGVSKIDLFSNNFMNNGSKIFSQFDSYRLANQLSTQSHPSKQHSAIKTNIDSKGKSFSIEKKTLQNNDAQKKKEIQSESQLGQQIALDIHWKAQKNLNFLINNYYSQINFKTMKNNKKINTIQNYQGSSQIKVRRQAINLSNGKSHLQGSRYKMGQQEQDSNYRLVLMNRYEQNPKLFLSSLKKK